jgi:hypothetical protein
MGWVGLGWDGGNWKRMGYDLDDWMAGKGRHNVGFRSAHDRSCWYCVGSVLAWMDFSCIPWFSVVLAVYLATYMYSR